jgi:predicted nucleic acid-binding protein
MRGTSVRLVRRPLAERAAGIRRSSRRLPGPVDHRSLDILIAATAIEHGLTLVTRNTRDHADIPGLTLYTEA